MRLEHQINRIAVPPNANWATDAGFGPNGWRFSASSSQIAIWKLAMDPLNITHMSNDYLSSGQMGNHEEVNCFHDYTIQYNRCLEVIG